MVFCRLFYSVPSVRGFFFTKEDFMKTPNFLRNLLQSNNYWNKNSVDFAKANEYLAKLSPGKLQQDVTGQYIEPKYDMTYEQFLDTQKKFDDDIQNAIQEAESENDNNITDYTKFVEVEEEIDVRVLMPWGDIQNEKLLVYTLNTPNDDNEPKETKRIWVWHSENDERICDDCASRNGEVFEDKNDIPNLPIHPNCRCWVEEIKLDDNSKPISSKVYKGQKPGTSTNNKEPRPDKIPTFDKPIDIKAGQYAKFDGKTLTIYQNGKIVASWNAVSGNEDFQSPEYQNLKSKGPISEGVYVARQEKLQYITPYGLVAGLVNKGTWPGSLYSWGNSRIALEASKETNTFDRGGFYVHGGWEPGSNGCIDLTSQMDDFTKWFENNGHDLIVNVKYE